MIYRSSSECLHTAAFNGNIAVYVNTGAVVCLISPSVHRRVFDHNLAVGFDAVAVRVRVLALIHSQFTHSSDLAAGDCKTVGIDAAAISEAARPLGGNYAAGSCDCAAVYGDVIGADAVTFRVIARDRAACSFHRAALYGDVSVIGTYAVAVHPAGIDDIAACDIQSAIADDGEIFVDIDSETYLDSVFRVAVRTGDHVLACQLYRKAGFRVDGSAGFVARKRMRALRDRRIIEGQGAAIPHDVVVVRSRARGRHRAGVICQGVGGVIRSARQTNAAHVDVGVGRGIGIRRCNLHGLAVEVFFIDNEVVNLCFLSKRRTADFCRVICIFASLDLDSLAGLRGNDDVSPSINGLTAACSFHHAAGDEDVFAIGINADAIGIRTGDCTARGGYRAAGDGYIAVGVDAVAVGVRAGGFTACGGNFAALYGDVSHVGVYAYAAGVTVCARGCNFTAGDGDIAAGVDAIASRRRYVAFAGDLDRCVRPHSGV